MVGHSNLGFAGFANSYGALGVMVSNRESLNEAMEIVLAHKGTALLEIVTDVSLVSLLLSWNKKDML